MTNTAPVILILGSGPNIGQHVAQAFATKGYKVALASRKPKAEENAENQVGVAVDLSDPYSVIGLFARVKELLGIPSVVIYNAGAATPNDAKNPLSLSLVDFTRDFNINTTSAFVAAQQAVLGFEQLPGSASKTFIYTGNILNTTTMAALMDLGVGKSATAHIIQSAASAYEDRGYKFYYADERKADGTAAYFDIDGAAHAALYSQLAEAKSQGPWQHTFVKDPSVSIITLFEDKCIFTAKDTNNESDHAEPLYHYRLYANHFETVDLVAETLTWLRRKTHPADMREIICAYGLVINELMQMYSDLLNPFAESC